MCESGPDCNTHNLLLEFSCALSSLLATIFEVVKSRLGLEVFVQTSDRELGDYSVPISLPVSGLIPTPSLNLCLYISSR